MKNYLEKSKSFEKIQLIVLIYALAFVLITWSFKAHANDDVANPTVTVKTTYGKIKIKLLSKEAPISTSNFLKYVDKKFYNGLIFHRVIKDFMIQGGGFDQNVTEKATLFPPIQNEAKNGLSNKRGTVAMARTNVVNSATAQFYINVVDNPFLDFKSENNYGYAVFGEVVEGMDVVDKIRNEPTTTKNGMPDVPTKNIIIESIEKDSAKSVNSTKEKSKSKK